MPRETVPCNGEREHWSIVTRILLIVFILVIVVSIGAPLLWQAGR